MLKENNGRWMPWIAMVNILVILIVFASGHHPVTESAGPSVSQSSREPVLRMDVPVAAQLMTPTSGNLEGCFDFFCTSASQCRTACDEPSAQCINHRCFLP
jgi:hypothetical protein